ncbi:MAG TPA: CoA-acylating methylmalonate-semialdehyde dehydrogenase [Dehalococcoidia bacterium]|nr:CoA-acylating methylmalonate-semialdehyde dehydrogenase [Dehalococcoidia bacterium]
MTESLQNYIDGRWRSSRSSLLLDVENPAEASVLAKVPVSTPEEVDEAVRLAHQAFLEWRHVPPPERVQYLFRLKHLLEEHKEELAVSITQENGKIIEEARAEMRRTLDNIEVACGIPSLMQGRSLQQISRGIDEWADRVPLGVFAIIPPFNFPAMVPSWFWPYAVACGNTVVIKPSERVPVTSQRLFSLIAEAGFPPGVVNLVNGDRTVSEQLVAHPDVVGISAVTSTPTARVIYSLAGKHGKRIQCGGGAKNFVVVMPDAVLDMTVPNIMDSVYGTAGQRCLAGSNVVAVDGVAEKLIPELVDAASAIVIGNGLDESVRMGPVISQASRQRIINYIAQAAGEGAELLLDGRAAKVPERGYFLGPTIFDQVRPEMSLACDEIFGPVMSILRVSTLDQAIDLINSRPYGNSAIIYTQSGKAAREFAYRVDCGEIGVNVGIAAPMAFFPFGGRKESFFGIVHGQGQDAIEFFTDKKIVIQRWW